MAGDGAGRIRSTPKHFHVSCDLHATTCMDVGKAAFAPRMNIQSSAQAALSLCHISAATSPHASRFSYLCSNGRRAARDMAPRSVICVLPLQAPRTTPRINALYNGEAAAAELQYRRGGWRAMTCVGIRCASLALPREKTPAKFTYTNASPVDIILTRRKHLATRSFARRRRYPLPSFSTVPTLSPFLFSSCSASAALGLVEGDGGLMARAH